MENLFDISQKILMYICQNEPVDDVSRLIKDSKIPEDTIKLNIERLYNARLIEGHLIHTVGSRFFSACLNLRISYFGLKELANLIKPITKEGKSIISINIGELNFDFSLAKLF
jgi:hypothetical protein